MGSSNDSSAASSPNSSPNTLVNQPSNNSPTPTPAPTTTTASNPILSATSLTTSSTPSPTNPPNTPASTTASAPASLGSSTLPTTSSSPNTLNLAQLPSHLLPPHLFNVTTNGIHLTALTLNDSTWPSDLVLDLGKSNWVEWSRKLTLLALRHGFEPWLDGSLPCPDPLTSANAAYIWKRNDADLRGFIRDRVSPAETHLVDHLATGHLMYQALKAHHEQQGAFAQINTLLKALQLEFSYEMSIRDKLAEIRTAYQRISAMGPIQLDDIFSVLLLNAMNKHMAPLQQHIHSLSSSPSFNSETIANRLLDEDALVRRREELGQPRNPYSLSSPPNASAFSATTQRARVPRPICANCKRENHSTDYCIAPGGKMAGRSIEEARAARQKARDSQASKPRSQNSSALATSPSPNASSDSKTVFVNGLPYVPDPSWTNSVPTSAHITEVPAPNDNNSYEYRVSIAFSDDSFPISLSSNSAIFSATASPPSPLLPFIIDTGATYHISPIASDFLSIQPIQPHPIKGLGNLTVDAVGVGTIEIKTPTGSLTLKNAFFVPQSHVRLLSAFLLEDTVYSSHFYPYQGLCFIADANNNIVVRGTALHDRKLFVLADFTVPLSSPSSPSHAYVTSRLPDIDTWHRRLGHCAFETIIKMARSGCVKGMKIDLSSKPSKCEHCILGKQTRSSIPNLREGPRATQPLAKVFVDLCGPMSLPSRSGQLYLMNIIDDYTSFVWSFPLISKRDSASTLKHWLVAQENQTPHRLKSFVTDNGELCSHDIQQWCQLKGILHLFTAPYTSAHNGRAERLHRTLMDKARAMRSQCNAPVNMWNEFAATAAYLTNLTRTSANKDKTPYELWYGHEPSLDHIHEIGCRAFALIPTHNPKINFRSSPCTLIGYAPQTKAFRLWDHSTDRIFNSFHVSFIESFELPSNPISPTQAPVSSHTPVTYPFPSVTSSAPTLQPFVLPSKPTQHTHPLTSNTLFPPTSTISTAPPSPNPLPNPTTTTPHLPPPPSYHPPPPQIIITPPSPSTSTPSTTTHQNTDTTSNAPRNINSETNSPFQLTPNTSPLIASPSPTLPHPNPNNNKSACTNTNDRNTTPIAINTTYPDTVDIPNNTHNTVTVDSDLHSNNTTDNNTNNNTVPPQEHQVASPPASPTSFSQPPTSPPPPSRIPLRRSSRLAAKSNPLSPQDQCLSASTPDPFLSTISITDPFHSAFVSEFTPLSHSHTLIPIYLAADHIYSSVSEVLSAIATGSAETVLDDNDDPTWTTALESPDREYWIAGACEELKSLADLKVFVLVPRSDIPQGRRPLKGKLVCKRKRDDAGNVTRYKVRYVVKGFAQRYMIDYDKTTAPTTRLASFRSILHLAAVLDWDIQHVDIKTAFLHGILPESETVFMEQPPGFETAGKEDWVMRLMKSLYGMKQASRIWNRTFHKALTALGFKRLACEWCVYIRRSSSATTIFAVHVDDIIFTSSSPDECKLFKAQLREHWEISDLGSAKFALGIAIERDRTNRSICLSQTALIDRIVEQFGQMDAHPVDTPMVAGLQIVRPDKSIPVTEPVASWIQRTPYRSLVGTLNYLAVATRPDIAFAVGRLASVLDCYRPEHWDAAIRVVRYLKGTRTFRLTLGGHNPIRPSGYSDSDYNNCPTTSRSIAGYCFSLGSGIVSWASHKQDHTADSSCYAEYISLHDASNEVIFLRQLLEGLGLTLPEPTYVYCDNDAARHLTEDQRWHARVRHIRVKYHSTRDLVEFDELKVLRVRSSENAADILTKPLARNDFTRLRQYLGVVPSPET